MIQNKDQQNLHEKNEPVQSQPSSSGAVSPWTPAPMPSLSSSQGLEYLRQASQMLVQLKLKLLLACRRIIYEIKNSMGQQVYTVTEDYNCLYQYFCFGNRSFTKRISDNSGCLVMEVFKPFECPLVSLCYNPKAEVRTESGVPMAYIVTGNSLCTLTFKILNENCEEVLKISLTPACCNMSPVKNFKITSIKEKTEVGRISIYRSGSFLCPNTVNFDVHFSSDLDVKMKAAILGTCLLFDL